jgi:hypothetical protein
VGKGAHLNYRSAILFILCCSLASAADTTGGKYAVVIGNGSYAYLPQLSNPTHDSEAIADSLRSLGFQVSYKENATQSDMDTMAEQLDQDSTNADVVLFYYAGHAIQVRGSNYLVPVDVKLSVEGEVRYKTLQMDVVLAHMEHTNTKTAILILDACRDNPLPAKNRAAIAAAGLASASAAGGTLLEYATAPGQTAQDGNGDHSRYTDAILHHIRDLGTDIQEVFRRVRHDVRLTTSNRQIPWESSSLDADLFLNPTPDSARVKAFTFDYRFEPQPGLRRWSDIGNDQWQEEYPDGERTLFHTLGPTDIGQDRGIIERRVDSNPFTSSPCEGSFEVFIPDKDSRLMWTRFRSFANGKWSDWAFLGEMHSLQ